MAADRAADFTFEAEIGYNTGAGTEVFFGAGIFTTVPAPGALALLGLGGLIARRRRA
jgi:MYXO-CTERM domain-containing protein